MVGQHIPQYPQQIELMCQRMLQHSHFVLLFGMPLIKAPQLQKQFEEEVNQHALDIEDLLQLGCKLGLQTFL